MQSNDEEEPLTHIMHLPDIFQINNAAKLALFFFADNLL